MKALQSRDVLALGFMTFALFVGAGNIIFPPIVGLQAGEHVWSAALGFLLTAVGLPVLTLIALARVGGGMDALSKPLGRTAARALAIVCYLSVGPLFATPRTATVSFEVGVAPLLGNGPVPLFLYSLAYFLVVLLVSLYPGRLLDTVGRFLGPLKILALAVLGGAALFWPAGGPATAAPEYASRALSQGFVNGYLTMDTLGALVFGIVIVNAIRARGVTAPELLTRYTVIAGLIAGVGLVLVYLSLFQLGAGSGALVPHAGNGAEVLHAYVQHTFGSVGSDFLAVLITLACLVTAVGLTCACAEFFSEFLPFSYRSLVVLLAAFSLLVSNLGLTQLIQVSVPILTAIYPPCIALVVLSFFSARWVAPGRIIGPVLLVALAFGILDGLQAAHLTVPYLNAAVLWLPLADSGLGWLLPAAGVGLVALVLESLRSKGPVEEPEVEGRPSRS
ncbi:branched-chain amino acid transport system II carrier protein [Pseudomonas sp. EpS/L25]|uniref:branched-chain amino acid transport system II carrier protein n=1 Tax=Pseudomonas sp. EpS/L25 TaxID=1749078 RepID=UPI0007442C9B|nr:branched-chain amino acid transport system II carrier protein [Pseudomonas sp. EpS/L25]KUM44808.1 branched-chain amino acid ABC transporter substrate-binding protein [Pseudomonas sp. EpS/L25]